MKASSRTCLSSDTLTMSMSVSDGGTSVYMMILPNIVSPISKSVSLRPEETLLYHQEHSLDHKFLHPGLNRQ
ncbi:hypothetical protein V6N12_071339 [Hibiscus sabdariffa]|uniref:Uncharacterized protein n=1 Tax=Hibiscus sabdariffa TaxID=183260 RepID=A0ABR2FJJ2_9ROSI